MKGLFSLVVYISIQAFVLTVIAVEPLCPYFNKKKKINKKAFGRVCMQSLDVALLGEESSGDCCDFEYLWIEL